MPKPTRIDPRLILYRCLTPLILPLLFLASPMHRKLRRGVWGRIGLSRRILRLKLHQPVWFHFSSSGEFEQALGLIDSFHNAHPETAIFLTYYSPSAQGAIQREMNRRKGNVPWSGIDFSPFDTPFAVRRFLAALRPRMLVVINRELWPELLYQTHLVKIPIALAASYFNSPNRPITYFGLRYVDWAGTIDESSAELLRLWNVKCEVLGDPRIERILGRSRTLPVWSSFFGKEPTLVLGSLWPEDFQALKESLIRLKSWRIIFVPHEPNEAFVRTLLKFAKDLPDGARRFQSFLRAPDFSSHIVVDEVGPLVDLYSVATAAFVGGSFKRRVHNVSEPAVRGIPVFTGPNISNSAEAVELSSTPILTRLTDGAALIEGLSRGLLNLENVREARDKFISKNSGVAERYRRSLERLCPVG